MLYVTVHAGAPPWFSPELARQPRTPIGTEAYTALLRAVLTAWQEEPDAGEGLLQRLHFAEYLRDILQVCTLSHICKLCDHWKRPCVFVVIEVPLLLKLWDSAHACS